MTNKPENIGLLISLGIAGAAMLAIVPLVVNISQNAVKSPIIAASSSPDSSQTPTPVSTSTPISQQTPIASANLPNNPAQTRTSLGDKILVTADKTTDKEAGIKAFAERNFPNAVTRFQLSLQSNRNDPETLIYLNNAKIGNGNALKVAITAPIGVNVNDAKEVLRGVAQAQDEINSSGGINGIPLQLQISSIDNFANASELDNALVKDASILAVVGGGFNEKIYNEQGLVKISSIARRPEQNQTQSSPQSRYAFYVSPQATIFSEALARHIVEKEKRTKIAICRDSSSPISKAVVQEYTGLIVKSGGKVSDIDCDLRASNFKATDFMTKAISDGVDGLLLIPSREKFSQVIEIGKANKGKLALFSTQQMYSVETLKFGQDNFRGMILTAPWHRDVNRNAIDNNSFADKAAKLWGGAVSPRTATAYDSLQVIIAGLKEGRTRKDLQKALSNPSFSVTGATGKIQFLPSGERQGGVFLLKVDACESGKPCYSSTGYDFVLVQ